MLTTNELLKATGMPKSTLALMVRDGYIKPAIRSYSKGVEHLFDEHAVAQLQRAVVIRKLMGDGAAARAALHALADAPTQTVFHIETTGGTRLELSLA